MRSQRLQRVLTLCQNDLNALLGAFFGLRETPAELQDVLADIRNQVANHEMLLQQLVGAVAARHLPTTSLTSQSPAHPAFEFSDINQPPVINGKAKPKLTVTQHDILMELLKVWPAGLSMEDLDKNSEHPEARKTLEKLARDADWRRVIIFPGKKNQGGYRLRST